MDTRLERLIREQRIEALEAHIALMEKLERGGDNAGAKRALAKLAAELQALGGR